MGKQKINPPHIAQSYDDAFEAYKNVVNPNIKKYGIATVGKEASSELKGYKSGIGESDYDKTLNWNADIDEEDIEGSVNEYRSQEQGLLPTVGAGLGRVASKVIREVGKTAGALGGLGVALIENTDDLISGEDKHDFLQTTFDNAFIKGTDKIFDNANKSLLPVYVSDAVENGNFTDKVTSSEFWATEGADGVGYMISAFAPGVALKALGASNKLFGAASKLTALRYGKSLEVARRGLAMAGVTANKIDSFIIPAANTFFEAGAESKGVGDDIEQRKPEAKIEFFKNLDVSSKEFQNKMLTKGHQLDLNLRTGKISIDEYNQLGSNLQNAVAEELFENNFKEQKSYAMRNTFLTNLAILAGPNYIQAKLLFGQNESKNLLKQLINNPSKNVIKQAGKRIGQSFLSEGSEEVAQTSTEHRQTDKAISGKLHGGLDTLKDISPGEFSKDFIKTLGTTEGKVAGFLGGFLGSGVSIVTGYRQDKRDVTENNRLLDKIKNAGTSLNDINLDSFEKETVKNEKGEDIEVFKKDEKGNKILNIENVQRIKKALDYHEALSEIYDNAVEEGDVETIQKVKKLAEHDLIMNFVGEDELTIDALKEHLKEILPTETEDKFKSKENQNRQHDIIEKAKYLQKELVSFQNMSTSIIKLENEKATPEQVKSFMGDLQNEFLKETSLLYELRKEKQELVKDKAKLESETSLQEVDNPNFDEDLSHEFDKKVISRVENPRLKTVTDKLTDLNKDIKDKESFLNYGIWNTKIVNGAFNWQINESDRIKKATSEEKTQATDNIINDIKSATTVEELDKIKPNEYTAEQFNEKREELESYKTGGREEEVAEKTADTNVRQVLKTDIPEYFDDMGESYRKGIDGNFYTLINRDSNSNILFENNTTGERVLAVDKITKQEETTVDDIVEGSANDFKVVDPKIVSDGTVKDDGKSPGSIKGNKQYADYLLESRDKTGDVVTFSINTSSFVKDKDSLEAIKLYDKLLKDKKFSATNEELEYLIKYLPIQFNYNNGSSSFSSHGGTLNSKLRTSIINALQSGVKLENLQSVVTNQANADFNNQIIDDKPAVNNVLDITEFNGDTKNLVLYHINTDGKFIVVSEKQEDFQGSHKVNTDLSGNIFIVMSHPKGYKVPAKLNSNKLNITQAEGLALLFKELTKSENTEQRDQVLANLESFDKIKDLLSKEIQLLGGNSNKISIDEMIKLLVLENSSKDSNKSIEIGIDEKGNQTVKFNNSEYNLENGIEDFVKDLTENKKQNVITIETDITKVGDKGITFKNQAYLEYLFNNKIVSTDINTNPEEGSFKTASSNTEQGSEVYIRPAVESKEISKSENNSENIRNNENNSVSLPNNVKIESKMNILNTQDNLDYTENLDKLISDNKVNVELQEMIDSLEKANNTFNNSNFKGMPEFMQNVTLKNIEKLNKQINETVEKLNKKC